MWGVRTWSTLRGIALTRGPRLVRRIAQLKQDFLKELQVQDGFTAKEGLNVHFKVDRNTVCIKGSYNIGGKEFSVDYPPYPGKAPELPAELEQIEGLAETAWKAFCKHDFLELRADGNGYCYAQVDESAVHRQTEIFKQVERTEHGAEVEAEKNLLVFRQIGGDIGTIVNGAGLAMSTVDTIELLDGKAANFLDAGGKATPETIKEAFRLVLKNEIKVVLVNVFGGVIQGDMIATGILTAVRDLNITLPVVARIQGTNGAKGMQMIRHSESPNLYAEENLYNAVWYAVQLSRKSPDEWLTKEEKEKGVRISKEELLKRLKER